MECKRDYTNIKLVSLKKNLGNIYTEGSNTEFLLTPFSLGKKEVSSGIFASLYGHSGQTLIDEIIIQPKAEIISSTAQC